VVGGMAVNIRGYIRNTEHIDLLLEINLTNETKVIDALKTLPEGAALELTPGEVGEYVVVRVCDEITVDLMAKACGHSYGEVKTLVTPIIVEGVTIPFASPKLLWLTKQTFREKDAWDREYLKKLLIDRGEWPVTNFTKKYCVYPELRSCRDDSLDFDHGLHGIHGFQIAPNRFGNHFHNLFMIRVHPCHLPQCVDGVFGHVRCAPIVVQFLFSGL